MTPPFLHHTKQTISKVLLQYCAILSKSFPSYCDKEKIVSVCLPKSSYYTSLFFFTLNGYGIISEYYLIFAHYALM